jgi:succinoglycan biosynthesis protein ExoA
VTALPRVTIVMPVRNEGAFIARSAGAALAQDYPPERLEVLVADGGSTDGTRTALRALQARHPNLEVVDNPGGIVPTGLNAALRQASGEVIVRVDGHTIVERDYVRECVAALERSAAETVGGRMDADGDSPFGRAVAAATSSPFGVGNARFHYAGSEQYVDTVYLGAWRRDVFERFGGFDEELVRNQDDEFNARVRAGGGRIFLTPRIRSRYFARSTPRTLWRQYFQYGLWKVRVMQKHPAQMQARQFVPAVFVAALTGLAAATPLLAPVRWGLAALALLYGSASLAAAAAVVARTRRTADLPRLVAVFAILHLAYGAGFLTGLARFIGRWGAPASAPAPLFPTRAR